MIYPDTDEVNRVPMLNALLSPLSIPFGTAAVGNSVQGQDTGPAVVNDQEYGVAMAFPDVLVAVIDAVYIAPVESALDGVKVAVVDGASYATVPATAPLGPVTVYVIELGVTAVEKVAAGVVVVGTPVPPGDGLVDTTDGTPFEFTWNTGSTK